MAICLDDNQITKPNRAEPVYMGAYFFVSAGMCLFAVWFSNQKAWIGDYWLHLSVLNQYSRNLLQPDSPFFADNTPDVLYSPYMFLLSLIKSVIGHTGMEFMSYVAIFHLICFIFALRYLVILISRNNRVAFLTLIFVQILWGFEVWKFSGFLNLESIYLTLAYPSQFAISASFVAIGLMVSYLQGGDSARVATPLLITILLFMVITTHPPSAIFLICGLFAVCLHYKNSAFPGFLMMLIFASVGAALWPYSWIHTLGDVSSLEFSKDAEVMYSRVLSRSFPGLLSVPYIIWRFHKKAFKPLDVCLLALSIIYMVGFLFKEYSLGRVLPYIVFILQLNCAYFLDHIFGLIFKDSRGLSVAFTERVAIIVLSVGYLVLAALVLNVQAGRRCQYEQFEFVSKLIETGAMVICPIGVAKIVTAGGGRVILTDHPPFFVKNYEERLKDLTDFFNPNANDILREKIVAKYKAKYILLPKNEVNYLGSFRRYLSESATTIAYSPTLTLYAAKISN